MAFAEVCSLPQTRGFHKALREVLLVLGSSILIALFAPVSIRLPFSPVPIATQLHVILFLAVLLGSMRSTAVVSTYLLYGALGFPVFAGGSFGLVHLFGPSGGYLFGYIFAASLTGYICECTRSPSLLRTLFAIICGNLLVYLTGSLWLGTFVGGWTSALLLGVLPFLPGDALKTVLVVKALRKSPARLFS